jgi:hypothetical protein
MGNRAKRKLASKLLKEHGFGPLYQGNKKVAWSLLRSGDLDSIIRKLSFKPGSLAHDCDGFNHKVVKWLPERHGFGRWRRGPLKGYVFHIAQFEKEDGSWSCGCPYGPTAPTSVADIEAFYRSYVNSPEMKAQGWLDEPYYDTLRESLNKGEPICDAQGRPLFKRY